MYQWSSGINHLQTAAESLILVKLCCFFFSFHVARKLGKHDLENLEITALKYLENEEIKMFQYQISGGKLPNVACNWWNT